MEEDTSELKPTGAIVFDGMVVPPFPSLIQDPRKRFEEIKTHGMSERRRYFSQLSKIR